MRLRIVEIEPSLLMQMISGHGLSRVTSDWPPDAEIVEIGWFNGRRSINILVMSSTFDEVPDRASIPSWTPTYTAHRPTMEDFVEVLGEAVREGS